MTTKQLNKYIPNDKLPEALKRPLVSGDREQIDALNSLAIIIDKIETEEAKKANADAKYYTVTVSFSGDVEVEVLAIDEEDAKEKALEDTTFDDCTFVDVDTYVREHKN